jgi:DNA-binding NarL/FixJ family response regulator
MNKRRVSVCLLSPHPFFLQQLQQSLRHRPFQLRIRRLLDGPEANIIPRAGVYVLDPSYARRSEGLIRSILDRHPKAKLLVFSEKLLETNVFPFLRMGVKGVLAYSEANHQLSRAVEAVAGGGFWVPRTLLSRFVASILASTGHRPLSSSADISRREKEILDKLMENLSNKEIANNLRISERTVKFHVSNLLAKHGVQRRSDLILLYFQRTQGAASVIQ